MPHDCVSRGHLYILEKIYLELSSKQFLYLTASYFSGVYKLPGKFDNRYSGVLTDM